MLSQIGLAGWELLSLLFPLFFLALLFVLIRWAVSSGVRSAAGDLRVGSGGEPSAREALDHRYASGEITQEEYLTIRDDIMRKPNA